MRKQDKIIAISYPLILLLISAACTALLLKKYSSGTYDNESDSLIIPLSTIAFTLLAQILLFSLQLPYYNHSLSTQGSGLGKKTLAVLAGLLSLLIYGWIIDYWNEAINLSLQAMYITAAIIFAALQYRMHKKR